MPDQEVELKLTVRSEDLPQLRNSPLLAAGQRGRGTTRNIENTYFDTADLRLRQRNAMLRVRKQGRRYLQTLRIAGEHRGGAVRQTQWEAPVRTLEPDLATIGGDSGDMPFDRVPTTELKPVFTTTIKRTTRHLNGGSLDGATGAIEVSIDEGEIRTPDGAAQPITEIELELKSGSARQLFDLALALSEKVPLRVQIRREAERGYALIADTAKPLAIRPAAV